MQYFITLSLLAPLVLATPTGQRRDLDTCGVRGYNKGGSVFQTTSSQDAAACGALCKQVTACQSFTVGPSGCTLYSGTSDYTADASSPNLFYGKLCTNYASTSSSSTTSSAASTTTTPATSNSGSGVCGAVGYDKSSPEAYESSENAADATRAGCAALCKAESQCKGYAYGSGTCLLYASTFSKNLDKESSSPYTFYDASCAGGSTATTTTPAAASTTPTTTASTKKCAVAGVEKSSASDSIVGFKFKPSAGCSKFCAGKSASSFEAYYDYCICFSKSVASVADAKSGAAGVFSDISC